MSLQICGLTECMIGRHRAHQRCDIAFPNDLDFPRRIADPLGVVLDLHVARHNAVHIDRGAGFGVLVLVVLLFGRSHRSALRLRTFSRCGCLSVRKSPSFSPAASNTPLVLPLLAPSVTPSVTSPTRSGSPVFGSACEMSVLFTASA